MRQGPSDCAGVDGESRGENHRAEGPNVAEGEQLIVEDPGGESTPPGCEHEESRPSSLPATKPDQTEKREPGRKCNIKWLKASEVAIWQKLDSDLSTVLEHSLRGKVDKKLNLFGDILYEECKARFGVLTNKQRNYSRAKGRRETEIDSMVQRRRQLRRRWRKSSEEEREGLKVLWNEVKQKLACMRRVERIRKRRKRKEKERSSFLRNPFRHARQLLEEKQSGRLEATKEVEHIRGQYSDPVEKTPLGTSGYVPRPPPPTTQFDSSPPRLSEVRAVVKKARSASAPGPNGIPYKLYKNCP
ncbi:hypothetical protein SKAU_G00231920 [Synaphobranchus kaupii]|uniref:Uncharacterized protein n=1 Tax=Synaphobranchus kaupii TaxID=118154 RepID=A0A9Q1ITG2_SYNKA|nr:hypothetical protein SKAU_G00231920 [Synaphobranchus kaupii]